MREGPYSAGVSHHGEGEVSMPDGGRIACRDLEAAQSMAGHLNAAWQAGYGASEAEAAKIVPLRPQSSAVQLTNEVLKLGNGAATLVTAVKKACADGHVAGAAAYDLGCAALYVAQALVPFAEAEAAMQAAAAEPEKQA